MKTAHIRRFGRANPQFVTAVALLVAVALFMSIHFRGIQVAGDGWDFGTAESDLARFLGFALMGIALVGVGRTWRLAALPVLVYAAGPLVTGFPCGPVYPGWYSLQAAGHVVAIGSNWVAVQRWCVPQAAPLFGVFVDLALVLLPTLVLASATRGRRESGAARRSYSLILRTAVVGTCLAIGLAVTVALSTTPLGVRASMGIVLPVFLFGALLGLDGSRWVWALVAVPALLTLANNGVSLLWDPAHYRLDIPLRGFLTLVACGCLGAIGARLRTPSGANEGVVDSVVPIS